MIGPVTRVVLIAATVGSRETPTARAAARLPCRDPA